MPDHVCRRLMLFLDGTWNQDDDEKPASNIVYLRERLYWGLATRLREKCRQDREQYDALPANFLKKGMSGIVFDGFEYIIFYDRGVGTGPFFDVIKGGVTGAGLDQNIRDAYRFLSCWFRPGDEIFVFGFSRGAYTARSLCGYLSAVGLLRGDACTKDNEERAWNYYRTPPSERLSGEWYALRHSAGGQSVMNEDESLRVRALCVFDTVGALGIPAEGLRRFNRAKYEFHDTEVNALVDIQLHAVAIDEPRREFEPSMWTKPKFKLTDPKKVPIEQAWFPGAHSDVGGGYVEWNQGKTGLFVLPLTWMLQRLQSLVETTPPGAAPPPADAVKPNYQAAVPFYMLDLLDEHRAINPETQRLALAEQHKPWAALSLVRPDRKRIINQIPLPNKEIAEQAGRVPFSDPIGEMVHVAAFDRFKSAKGVTVDKGKVMNVVGKLNVFAANLYRPKNLIAVFPYVAATYLRKYPIDDAWSKIVKPIFSWKEVGVVDWNGKPLDPERLEDVKRVMQLLPSPRDIGLPEMPVAMRAILRRPTDVAPAV